MTEPLTVRMRRHLAEHPEATNQEMAELFAVPQHRISNTRWTLGQQALVAEAKAAARARMGLDAKPPKHTPPPKPKEPPPPPVSAQDYVPVYKDRPCFHDEARELRGLIFWNGITRSFANQFARWHACELAWGDGPIPAMGCCRR